MSGKDAVQTKMGVSMDLVRESSSASAIAASARAANCDGMSLLIILMRRVLVRGCSER
jgi:hypothetical protein